jgi:hypothetical protein
MKFHPQHLGQPSQKGVSQTKRLDKLSQTKPNRNVIQIKTETNYSANQTKPLAQTSNHQDESLA